MAVEPPIIAISSRRLEDPEYGLVADGVSNPYVSSVRMAGGAPVLLPLGATASEIEAILGRCDGLLLSGGEDLSPALYGEPPSPKLGKTSDGRDSTEPIALEMAIRMKLPIFGICRGLQLINAVFGGSLYQDLGSEFQSETDHNYIHTADCWVAAAHEISIEPDTLLKSIIGFESVKINSLHHQGIRKLGTGLRVAAKSSGDGLIEAIEIPGNPFGLAVQWHPEVLWQDQVEGQKGLRDEVSRKLFQAFVAVCKKYRTTAE